MITVYNIYEEGFHSMKNIASDFSYFIISCFHYSRFATCSLIKLQKHNTSSSTWKIINQTFLNLQFEKIN